MMKMTDKDMEELEAYMEDSLTEQEKIRFEEKMQNNKALKETYKNRLKTKQLWTAAQEFTEEKEKIKLILSKENNRFNKRILWQTIAAAAVFILMIGSYYYINHKNMGSPELQMADEKVENTLSVDEPVSYAKQKTYLSVLLIQPKNDQEMSQNQTILFKWEGLSSADSLMVFNVVNDVNDDLVFKQLLNPNDSTLILPAHKLNEGTYYWQISNKKETFIIPK